MATLGTLRIDPTMECVGLLWPVDESDGPLAGCGARCHTGVVG